MDVLLFYYLVSDCIDFLQENSYWLDRILRSYQSRIYSGDVGTSFEVCTVILLFLWGTSERGLLCEIR